MPLWGRFLCTIAGLFIGAILLFFTVWIFGHVRGEEFSPDTFEVRSFSYYRIPLTEIQVKAVRHHTFGSALRDHLIRKNLLPKSANDTPRWDLVYRQNLWSREAILGDAQFLVDFLPDFRDGWDDEWLTWTQDHPDLAAILWPAVAELARTNLYIFVPDLLELAEVAEQPDDLERQIDQTLAEQYYQVAEIHRKEGRHDSAVRYYDMVLDHDPTHSKAAQGRELCQSEEAETQ